MPNRPPLYRVTVFVLGDLGRSPRMLNHALALAADGAAVSLIGYNESALENAVAKNPSIRVFGISTIRRASDNASRSAFFLRTALRTAWLGMHSLWLLLAGTPRPNIILVQNPPSFPTLFVAWIAARLRGSRLIVDWHNFGYSMLAMRLGDDHSVVRRAKVWERRLSRKAHAHFCVSSAMQERLIAEFGLKSPVVLLDKPRELFPVVPISARADRARELLRDQGIDLPSGAAFAVSPTSWTADEDMPLLFDGLQVWDSQNSPGGPKLLVLITGRGPLRAVFESRSQALRWRRIILRTAFLDPAVYRGLLCAAHFGFCLHRSSSGVDLPMKIIDLFGARTPVCAFDYGNSLSEQIAPGVTAVTFRDPGQLAHEIDQLLQGFPENPWFLDRIQSNITKLCTETWQDAWSRQATPVMRELAGVSDMRAPPV